MDSYRLSAVVAYSRFESFYGRSNAQESQLSNGIARSARAALRLTHKKDCAFGNVVMLITFICIYQLCYQNYYFRIFIFICYLIVIQ